MTGIARIGKSLLRNPPRLHGRWLALCGIGLALAMQGCVQTTQGESGNVTVTTQGGNGVTNLTPTVQVFLVMTALAMGSAVLLLMTSFTRIVIVLSLLRTAIGVPQLPPAPIITGLSLVLTMFVMMPTWQAAYTNGVQPYMDGKIGEKQAYDGAVGPLRTFMFRQVREDDLALFVHMAQMERPKNENGIPTHVLVPAFALSELRIAFQMGALLFVPFLIVDLVVASVLMTLGMMMLPPTVVSLPFKLLLFVLVDGWTLVVMSLVNSYK